MTDQYLTLPPPTSLPPSALLSVTHSLHNKQSKKILNPNKLHKKKHSLSMGSNDDNDGILITPDDFVKSHNLGKLDDMKLQELKVNELKKKSSHKTVGNFTSSSKGINTMLDTHLDIPPIDYSHDSYKNYKPVYNSIPIGNWDATMIHTGINDEWDVMDDLGMGSYNHNYSPHHAYPKTHGMKLTYNERLQQSIQNQSYQPNLWFKPKHIQDNISFLQKMEPTERLNVLNKIVQAFEEKSPHSVHNIYKTVVNDELQLDPFKMLHVPATDFAEFYKYPDVITYMIYTNMRRITTEYIDKDNEIIKIPI
jgi:hypothetical protein